jgi:hypothetical protein
MHARRAREGVPPFRRCSLCPADGMARDVIETYVRRMAGVQVPCFVAARPACSLTTEWYLGTGAGG